MNIYDITSRQFKNLEKYEVSSISTECELYIINNHYKWIKEHSLFKKFFITEGEYFSNKLYTINTLIYNKKDINIPELIFPNYLISIDHQINGFAMPFIQDSINFAQALKTNCLTMADKIRILKQIQNILNKVHSYPNFYITDIHEANFLINTKTGTIKVGDLDSCKIGANNASPAKYLNTNKNIRSLSHKYVLNKDGIYEPNINSEIFCFLIMVLNAISGININVLSIEQFYDYISYLDTIGFDRNLIQTFGNIYTGKNNYIDNDLLNLIPLNHQSLYKIYTYNKTH